MLFAIFCLFLSNLSVNLDNSFSPPVFLRDSIPEAAFIMVLGTVQDAGSPHIGCTKDCCKDLFGHPDASRKVVSLGLVDPVLKKHYLFEATPDMPEQLKLLKNATHWEASELPDGIFITHAHIGHYTGLMYLGREGRGAKQVPVYAMPGMEQFLRNNGPWSQLVTLENIDLQPISNENPIILNPQLEVTPFLVPHRDEYSETVGYKISGPKKSALFIPDIDKWEKWQKNIVEEIKAVDYAFIDATFYDAAEINNRNISEIPHPFIIESMAKFSEWSAREKQKIIFIHLNHTNPALDPNSEVSKSILEKGFRIARIGDTFEL